MKLKLPRVIIRMKSGTRVHCDRKRKALAIRGAKHKKTSRKGEQED